MTSYKRGLLRQSINDAGAPPPVAPTPGQVAATPTAPPAEAIPAPGQPIPPPVARRPQTDAQIRALTEASQALVDEGKREKARRQGLDKLVGERIPALETRMDGTDAKLDAILKQLKANAGTDDKSAPASPPASSTTSGDAVPEGNEEMMTMILETRDENRDLRATINRENMVRQMTRPGEPGEGIRLDDWVDLIPLVPPVAQDDGSIDNSGQRDAIQNVIDRIKGERESASKNTQSFMTDGATPGSTPPPGQTGPADELEELTTLWAKTNDPAQLEMMDEGQFREAQARIDELQQLMPQVTSGYRPGWLDLQGSISALQQQYAGLARHSGYQHEGPPAMPPPGV